MSIDPETKKALNMRLAKGEISEENYNSAVQSIINNNPTGEEKVVNDHNNSSQTNRNNPARNSKKTNNCSKLVFGFLFIGLVGIGAWGASNYYVVNTHDGLKYYKKKSPGLNGTYVDMKSMSFIGLRNHTAVVKTMQECGDLEYVPGGETLQQWSETGAEVIDAINKFDDAYKVTNSVQEINRIGRNKYQQLDRKYDFKRKAKNAKDRYQQLDRKYDLNNKAKAAEKRIENGAKKFNKWLKKK